MDEDSIDEQQLIEVGISQGIEMIEQSVAEQSCLKEKVEGTSNSKTKSLHTTSLSSSSTTTPSIMAAVAALGLPVTIARDMVTENGDTNNVKNTIVRTITVGGADNDSHHSSTNQNALTIIPSSNRRFVLQSTVNENGKCEQDNIQSLTGESYNDVNFEDKAANR